MAATGIGSYRPQEALTAAAKSPLVFRLTNGLLPCTRGETVPGENWDRIQEIFLEIADLPVSEREAILDRVCHGDAALRREVESLLRADDTGGSGITEALESEATSLLDDDTPPAGS